MPVTGVQTCALPIWHLDYLKQYRRITYTNLLTSGKLNTYLADIDRQAQERFDPAEKNIIFAPLKTPGMAHGRRTKNPLAGICGRY